MATAAEQMGKLMGDALARGFDREMERRCKLLILEMKLISLELELRLQKRR